MQSLLPADSSGGLWRKSSNPTPPFVEPNLNWLTAHCDNFRSGDSYLAGRGNNEVLIPIERMSISLNTSKVIEIRSAIVGDPLIVTPDTTVSEAIAKMSELRTRCYPANDTQRRHLEELHAEIRTSCVLVVEADRVVGILTERDVMRLCAHEYCFENVAMSEVMLQPVVTLAESGLTSLFLAIDLLNQQHICHLPIIDEGGCLLGFFA